MREDTSRFRKRVSTLGWVEARLSVTSFTFSGDRPVRMRSLGVWVARVCARVSPRPFGPTPVMRTGWVSVGTYGAGWRETYWSFH